jgi:CRISPR-associated endonuclease/helicase Cas3
VAANFRLIQDGLAPVIVPRNANARKALVCLRDGLPAGDAARRLQAFVVQVPPRARNLLCDTGHVRFVDWFGDQFAELVTDSLYRDDTGLLWENAEYLARENSIV